MKRQLPFLAAALLLLTQAAQPQSVKLAGVALGMSEEQVRTALAASAPRYLDQGSGLPGLQYLVAETEAESFAFTLIDGRVAGFSLMHILAPGQQPYLPPGQVPTVSVLRDLVTKQTWTPAAIDKGDTVWLSGATGVPLLDASACTPKSGEAWLPLGPVPGPEPGAAQGGPPAKSTEGLKKPALAPYPAACGVSIHLHESPGDDENGRVRWVQIQVLDMKAMNAFLAEQQKR